MHPYPQTPSVRPSHFSLVWQTICILLRSLFRKKFSSFGVNALDVLCTEDAARAQFTELLSTFDAILLNKDSIYPDPFRRLAMSGLVIIATATEKVTDNPFLIFFMDVDLFDTIVQV